MKTTGLPLWLCYLFLALSALLFIALAVFYRWMPADGATGDLESFTPAGFRVQWLLEERPHGLQVGDIILTAGGYSAEEWLAGASRDPEWHAGEVVTYHIQRNGQSLTLPIRLEPIALGVVLRRWVPQLIVMVMILINGLFVFWKRPKDLTAQLLLFFCVASALQTWGDAHNFQFALLPWGWPFWVRLVWEQLSYCIAFSIICHFISIFPTPHALIKNSPRLVLLLIYFGPMLAILLFTIIAPTWSFGLVRGNRASLAVGAVMTLSIIISLIQSAIVVRKPVERAQFRWFVWGAVTPVTILLGGYSLPIALGYPPLIPHPAIIFMFIFAPLIMGIAVLRYRLWNIDFLINRSLVYGSLTILLAAVFTGIVYGVSLLTAGQYAFFAFGSAAAVAGLLFRPVRYRLVRFVDRRLYNIRIDYYQKGEWHAAPAAEAQPALLGRLKAYTDLKLIARGGMSEIYQARHAILNRPVAIKLLPAHLATDPDLCQRFDREALLASRLKQENVIRLLDFGKENGTHYMIMEYISGQSLKDHLAQHGRLSLAQAYSILSAVANALDYIHSQGIVHRDVNPSNVMLEPQSGRLGTTVKAYRPVLMDFGIAKLVGSQTQWTQQEALMGTLNYIAPEQIQAIPEIDGRADVYSLGAMAFEMLTGQPPFRYNQPGALLMAHLLEPPPDANALLSGIPEPTARAMQRAMAKAPAERFSSAGEFVQALRLTLQ